MTLPVVRRVTVADTAMARALRLEMLADTPLAFVERLEEAVARPHAAFRSNVAERAEGNATALFVAVLVRLVEAVADGSAAAGRPVLELEVASFNDRAIRAYQRLGFVDTGRPVRHPRIPLLAQRVMRRPAVVAPVSDVAS